MPRINSITIKNFKGIEEATIDLRDKIHSPVLTLIGLNESGKTTILEALSHFITGDNTVDDIFEGVHSKSVINELIPVHRKAAFTGEIIISAIVELDDEDCLEAQKLADSFRLTINKEKLKLPFNITKKYEFKDSKYVKSKFSSTWGINIFVTPKKGKNEKEYVRPKGDKPDLWQGIINLVKLRLPKIAYFPTFLVNLPEKIYLKEHDDEKPSERYYRLVIQDILLSLNEGLDLETHVCKRIEEYKEESDDSNNWLPNFLNSDTKLNIDSVFQKLSHAITKEVLGSWKKIFQRNISAKNISVDWLIDANNLPYASFKVSDGESLYQISERSLGFRWFFSFLLFTAFKKAKERQTIFLFDEPAANLHAKAQAELLKSFSRIVEDGHRIIYSTHSHHMINPYWLSGAYIVENKALDYDSGEDSFGINAEPTRICTSKYRQFISQYSSRSSYFQPVIEKLEYVTPDILGNSPFVIVEGISDYYAFTLAARARNDLAFSLMPGAGSGASSPLISLLMGRGEQFVLLLDDDKAGVESATKYQQEWFLNADLVVTLGDLNTELKGKRMEGLLSEETLKHISNKIGVNKKPNKKQIGFYLAEAVATGKKIDEVGFSKETVKTLNTTVDALNKLVNKVTV